MIQQTIFPFKLEKTSETLTAHGGLALLSEFNQSVGLDAWVDKCLPGPGSNRGFRPSVFVKALVLMLQGGGAGLEDLRDLDRELGLLSLMGDLKLPDPGTSGDWLRRMGDPGTSAAGLLGLDRVRTMLNRRVLAEDPRAEYTLDMDATQIESWKREAAFTYQGVKGYMPMLGYLSEPGLCVYDEFREGNISPGDKQLSFYESCRSRMPGFSRIAWLRSDSAAYGSDLVNRLEGDGVIFTITAPHDSSVKEAVLGIPEEAWSEPEPGCGFEVAETVHSMEKTKQAFRLIAKRAPREQGDLFSGWDKGFVYHAVASNWPVEEKGAYAVLQWHNQRGQAENYHKELKIGFGMEKMPCGESYANAVYFRIGVIAYNLFIGFKRLAGPESWVSHTISTFRWKLIQTAGRIVRHAGRVFLKLSVSCEQLIRFREIRHRCFDLWVAESG